MITKRNKKKKYFQKISKNTIGNFNQYDKKKKTLNDIDDKNKLINDATKSRELKEDPEQYT